MPRLTGPRPGAPSDDLRDRIIRAATLRAEGRPWSAVAEELGLTAATVQSYPRKYPKLWAVAERRAWDRALAEAAAEAVTTLRRLLRSDDDKINRDAAAKLVQFAARRLRPPAARKTDAAVPPILAYLESLHFDDITTLAAEILSQNDGKDRTLDANTTPVPS